MGSEGNPDAEPVERVRAQDPESGDENRLSPRRWATHYPKMVAAYMLRGERGLAGIEERLRKESAARPRGKFTKREAAYVPFVPLPPFDWRHECGHCRFWVDHGPDKAGECMIVGTEGDYAGGKSIHEKAGCALFMPPAGEAPFDWIAEQLDPTGADLVRGEWHARPSGTAGAETTNRDRSRRQRASGEPPSGDVSIPAGTRVGLETVADGFAAPVGLAVDPGDADRRFVADQVGLVHVHGPDGLRDEPLLDLRDRLVELEPQYDERGLLGLALHPEFGGNGKFYVRFSAPPGEETPEEYSHDEILAEFRATDDRTGIVSDSERELLRIPKPQFNHNAGDIAFGPDGYLYVAIGDGGSEGDTGAGHVEGGNGQDVEENLLGSILRIDVDTSSDVSGTSDANASEDVDGKPYGIPDDNPLVGETGLDEHYAWGLRNPWRISFDGEGRLFAADVGQHLFEEVNVVEKGGNYGWNVKEGFHCFDPENPSHPPADCPEESERGEPFRDPIVEYPHVGENGPIGSAVVGGHVYEGDAIPELEGKYVFGDWAVSQDRPSGRLFAAEPPADGDGGRWSMRELVVSGTESGRPERNVLGFARDGDGELYVLTSETHVPKGETGAVHRLVAP